MIGFNLLGNLGRIGNQMFQYASLRGISSYNNYDWIIPPEESFGNLDPNVKNNDTSIYKAFELKSIQNTGFIQGEVLEEKHFHFDENLFKNCPDNVNLHGYFQSEKYFKHIEDDLRKDFTFIDEIYIPTKEMFDSFFGDSEVISLHIRRGDYVGNQNHPLQTMEYYETGLKFFDNDIPVMVFSDDIEWCKKQTIFSGDRFIFSEDNDTSVDLMLQSLCKYHIIANSSFSWWGSWLAKSEKVIAPKKWLGRDVYLKDLYCKDWIVL